MKISKVVVGYLEENCYILEKNNKVIIIDPGDEAEKIIKEIGNKEVVAILITHNHFDHIGALNTLKNKYKVKVLDGNNLEEKEYKINDFIFEVIFTKGHSDDSVTYYFKDENVMFVGDFIFKDSIGRCDLETGNINKMKESIEKIKKYPNVILYPGHGVDTTLDYEKENNIYFKNIFYM